MTIPERGLSIDRQAPTSPCNPLGPCGGICVGREGPDGDLTEGACMAMRIIAWRALSPSIPRARTRAPFGASGIDRSARPKQRAIMPSTARSGPP